MSAVPGDFVEVTWVDAKSTCEWARLGVTDLAPAKCITRGWLIAIDETEETEYIVMASTKIVNDADSTWGEVLTLPTGMVVGEPKVIKLDG